MKLRAPRCLPLACLVAVCLAGCSSGLEGVEKKLSSMQDEIMKLQNQNDRLVERVDAMEVADAHAARAKPAAKQPSASERPSLKVVKVVPDDPAGMPTPQVGTQAPGDAADDPTPRPVIRVRGSTGSKSEGKTEGKSEG